MFDDFDAGDEIELSVRQFVRAKLFGENRVRIQIIAPGVHFAISLETYEHPHSGAVIEAPMFSRNESERTHSPERTLEIESPPKGPVVGVGSDLFRIRALEPMRMQKHHGATLEAPVIPDLNVS